MQQDLNEYFQERFMHIKKCYFAPVHKATPIYKGQVYKGGLAEIFEDTTAPMDGYLIETKEGPVFWTVSAFKGQYQDVNDWLKERPRTRLSENFRAQAVCKGASITVHALERSKEKTTIYAPEDGWIVETKHNGRASYMDDLTFRSLYETNAPIMQPTANLYRERKLNTETPIKFVRLHKEMLLRAPQGTHNINFEKGSFAVQLPGTLPREYQVFTMPEFFRLFTPEKPIINGPAHKPDVIKVDFKNRKAIKPK
jgi:hypothetical protein